MYRLYCTQMPSYSDHTLQEFETGLAAILERLKEEFRTIRSNRPSLELLENIKINYYDQWLPLNMLGSLSIRPPREIEIAVWDSSAVLPIVKAIESAKIGLSVSSDGNVVKAFLPSLTDERRQELAKFAGKTAEAKRIQLRSRRDETIKKIKSAEEKKEITEDQFFHAKEKIQKLLDEANEKVETVLRDKIKEIEE